MYVTRFTRSLYEAIYNILILKHRIVILRLVVIQLLGLKSQKSFIVLALMFLYFKTKTCLFRLINQRNCILKFERNVCTQLEDKAGTSMHTMKVTDITWTPIHTMKVTEHNMDSYEHKGTKRGTISK